MSEPTDNNTYINIAVVIVIIIVFFILFYRRTVKLLLFMNVDGAFILAEPRFLLTTADLLMILIKNASHCHITFINVSAQISLAV